MFNVAYDKETKQILGFIECDYDINPEEVFGNFENYEVIKTNKTPPTYMFDKYVLQEENGDISYKYIEENEDGTEESTEVE